MNIQINETQLLLHIPFRYNKNDEGNKEPTSYCLSHYALTL